MKSKVMKSKAVSADLQIQLPPNLENLSLPAPELVTYYQNLNNRTVWIDFEIDESCLEVERLILHWNKEDEGVPQDQRKPIKLLIFSPGGALSVYESLADVISMSNTKVIGVNMGEAASAACFIYLSCHERLALPSAKFLLHRGSVDGLSGSYAEVIAAIESYQEQIEKLCAKIVEKTSIKAENIEEYMQADWYMTAEEAVQYRVCDRIVKNIDEIL